MKHFPRFSSRMRAASVRDGIGLGFLGLLFGAGMVGVLGMSCASAPDVGRVTEIIQPDFAIYKAEVDTYLNRRCGTLDCHGQFGRAYRLYGQTGLRLIEPEIDGAPTPDGGADGGAGSPELVTGQQPTTDAEVLANYQSLIAIEPEEMSRVVAAQGQGAENKLVILRKPLMIERHKGGEAMRPNDQGFNCITGWLNVPVVDGNGDPIPPSQRIMSDFAKRECARARSLP